MPRAVARAVVRSVARSVAGAAPVRVPPRRMLVDTDYAFDWDDVCAVEVAAYAHNRSEIDIVAFIVSSSLGTSAPALFGHLSNLGLQSIPIGAYQGATGTYSEVYGPEVRERFGVSGQTRSAYTDDLTTYRTAFESARIAGVPLDVATVGAFTAVSAFLASSADGISALTGAQLVAANHALGGTLYVMGGRFPGPGAVEANFGRDKAATKNVIENWPGRIVCQGYDVGDGVLSRAPDAASALLNACRYAFERTCVEQAASLSTGKNRSWDPVLLYYAIYGEGSLFEITGTNGSASVNVSTGIVTWSSTPGFVSYSTAIVSDATLDAILENILKANSGISGDVNLIPASQELTRAEWIKAQASIAADAAVTASGEPFFLFTEDSSNNLHAINPQNIQIVSGQVYTSSYKVKQHTNIRYVQIFLSATPFGGTAYANFDLQGGVLGTVGASATAAITSLGNGEYRISVQATATADGLGTGVLNSIPASNSARNAAHVGSTSDKLLVTAGQFEDGVLSNYEATL